jgi:ribosomal protein L19
MRKDYEICYGGLDWPKKNTQMGHEEFLTTYAGRIIRNKTGNVRTNVTLRCVRVTTVAVEKQ